MIAETQQAQTATVFNHETVVLDGGVFTRCEFLGCRLIYNGGEVPVFSDCRFNDCDWRLEDAAARTLAHLKLVWNAGGKGPVQALIKDVTSGSR